MSLNLNQAGKEELAVAIYLWKEFKYDGKLDVRILKQALRFADELGIRQEFDELMAKMPALKITRRYE